jgi:AmmeMemoRadiSam system protein B
MTHATSIVRPPAVAGSFYPMSAHVLAADVEALLEQAPAYRGPPPKALVVPHAGYVYSGPIAATAYAALRSLEDLHRVRRVVLVGPSHRVYLRGVAAPAAGWLRTPLGDVEVDEVALDRAGVTRDAAAHAREHSLEVQLPFLQRVVPQAKVCPIVCGQASTEEVGRVIESLWDGDDTVVVVSSDLSHYLPYAQGRAVDEETAARIVSLDDEIDGEQACGYVGLRGLLWVARRKGLVGKLLDLRSSGDTAGPRDEVVGYGAFAFWDGAMPQARAVLS